MKKKVLFIAPNHFGIYQRIIRDFKLYDFEVTPIILKDWGIKKTLSEKLNLFLRTKKKEIDYFKLESELQRYLKKYDKNHFDTCFIIRPDYFTSKSIQVANSLAKYSIAYQWDGIDRFPNTIDKIKLFDTFFVFDISDFQKYNIRFSNIQLGHNFYFDDDNDIKKRKKIDVFYLGTYVKERNIKMMRVYEQLKTQRLKIKILLCAPKKTKKIKSKFKNRDIKVFRNVKNYKETLSYTKSTSILLDLLIEEHQGLSFRFFEALKYKKKIITTNPSIVNYEFYRPENIFVITENNLNELENFTKIKYFELPSTITEKYSFINWFIKNTH